MALPKINTLIDVLTHFSDEKVCLEHLKQMRWGGVPYCPHCGCEKVYEFSDGKRYKCAACRKQFTAKVGSIFEDSKIPLRKWFAAIWLITSHKKGISSLQLSKDLGVTQKTAWFMLHRLRHASQTQAFQQPLTGTVECDETYVGGKEKNKHKSKRQTGTQGRSTKTKSVVIGMLERDGKVMAVKTENAEGKTVRDLIISNIVFGSNIVTDEYRGYKGLEFLFTHTFVLHGSGQYVNGEAHTNTIEGFWSLLKRGIIGIYHSVSPKHLQRYLNEFSFRYNSRQIGEGERFNMVLQQCNGRLNYKTLIA